MNNLRCVSRFGTAPRLERRRSARLPAANGETQAIWTDNWATDGRLFDCRRSNWAKNSAARELETAWRAACLVAREGIGGRRPMYERSPDPGRNPVPTEDLHSGRAWLCLNCGGGFRGFGDLEVWPRLTTPPADRGFTSSLFPPNPTTPVDASLALTRRSPALYIPYSAALK
jgi:hypothetical protein